MEWTYVDSSWVEAVRANHEGNYLDIKFKNGKSFRYDGAAIHYDGMTSGSSGKYFHQYLKTWPCTEIFE
jgi:hypothetical protein